MDRRDFLKLAAMGSVVLVTGLDNLADAEKMPGKDHFVFLRLS